MGKIAELVKGKRIIDFGFAETPNPFLEGGVIGVDINKPYKMPKNYDRFVQQDLNETPYSFRSGYADCITASEVIEHLERPYDFLKECHRILKPKGKLLLSTPNAFYYTVFVSAMLGKWKVYAKKKTDEHLQEWSIPLMKYNLEKFGFKVVNVLPTFITIPKTRITIGLRKVLNLSSTVIYECVRK
ncbi:MAG: methyltransferase domain-containing protein [archaeon]